MLLVETLYTNLGSYYLVEMDKRQICVGVHRKKGVVVSVHRKIATSSDLKREKWFSSLYEAERFLRGTDMELVVKFVREHHDPVKQIPVLSGSELIKFATILAQRPSDAKKLVDSL